MESPMSHGPAVKIISQAYQEWWEAREKGCIGLSLGRCIADALQNAGYLQESDVIVYE